MRIRVLGTAMFGLVAAAPVHAEERIFLAGGEYSDVAYYSYAGLIVLGPGRENGRGFLQRYWVDRFGYEYDGAPGRVEADAFGAEAALGYGASTATGWWTVSLGLRYTNTDLSPDDRSASARGDQLGGKLQLELDQAIAANWRASAIASYSNRQDGYWGRVRVMHQATSRSSVGIEFVANGNDEADSTATGLVLGFKPSAGRWSVNLRAGYRFQDEDDGAFGGLEFGYGF